jgi:hypothetical protein
MEFFWLETLSLYLINLKFWEGVDLRRALPDSLNNLETRAMAI